jgi:hypothetical protein
MSFRQSVTRKNLKSRYKKAAERALAQPLLESLLRINYILQSVKIIPRNYKTAV